jgi:hypothetical protein
MAPRLGEHTKAPDHLRNSGAFMVQHVDVVDSYWGANA